MHKKNWALPIIVTALVAGCSSETVNTPPPVQPQPVESAKAPAQTPEKQQNGDVESSAGNPTAPGKVDASPDALAKQTESYTKAMDDMLRAQQKADMEQRGVQVVQMQVEKPAPAQADPNRAMQSIAQPKIKAVQQATPDANVSFTPAYAPTDNSANAPVSISQPVVEQDTKAIRTITSPQQRDTGASGIESQLASRAREYPRDLASQLDYQLLLFLKDESVPKAADIANLPSEDREILTSVLDGLSNFRSGIRTDNNMLMNRKIRPLVDTLERLRTRADMSIPFATLCREVKSFGVYTPFDQTRFEAGTPIRAIVYSEVENVSSQLNDKQAWQTHLTQEITLYTETGMNVWTQKTKVNDVCRNRRRDFYTCPLIEIKDNLSLGRYMLKISITDEQASRIAETSIPIAVVAKQ